jgi:hypothetical protein
MEEKKITIYGISSCSCDGCDGWGYNTLNQNTLSLNKEKVLSQLEHENEIRDSWTRYSLWEMEITD